MHGRCGPPEGARGSGPGSLWSLRGLPINIADLNWRHSILAEKNTT